jgi:hypothetical protein
MIGPFSRPYLGILAAFLVTVTLPVMAENSVKGSGGNCPAAAGLNSFRPVRETRVPSYVAGMTRSGLAECPAFSVLPKYGILPIESRLGVEARQWTASSAAFDVREEDQGAGYDTAPGGGRLARFLHHVTWSWGPTPPYGDPFQTGAVLNRY